MPWKKQSFHTIGELFQEIMALKPKIACRGQADVSWGLQSSLDRMLATDEDYAARLALEKTIFVSFRKLALEYFGRIERMYLQDEPQGISVLALTLLQHYGTPTRVLDWTNSPWIALYYAAIHHHDRDGAVWWFKEKRFEAEVDQRWKKYGMPRRPGDGQIDLDHTSFKTDGPNWITKLHCPIPFARLEAQQGFFTLAGRLGVDHGERIAHVLPCADSPGICVIPGGWKQQILDRLRSMNVHATALMYPGADHVGHELMASLKRRVSS